MKNSNIVYPRGITQNDLIMASWGYIKQIKGSPVTRFVLTALMTHYPNMYASQEYMAEHLGLTRRCVNKQIQKLKEDNIIYIKKRHKHNVYYFTDKFLDMVEENLLRIRKGKCSHENRQSFSYEPSNVLISTDICSHKQTNNKINNKKDNSNFSNFSFSDFPSSNSVQHELSHDSEVKEEGFGVRHDKSLTKNKKTHSRGSCMRSSSDELSAQKNQTENPPEERLSPEELKKMREKLIAGRAKSD